MKKLFIPIREAKILKELGFNKQCFATYENNTLGNPSVILHIRFDENPVIPKEHKLRPAMFKSDNRNSVIPQWMISAPTYQQAFKWFRKKYKLESYIFNDEDGYNYFICNTGTSYESAEHDSKQPYRKKYKKSEYDCLKKLIKLVKENKIK